MSKFRKKPVNVEAIQWTGSEKSYNQILSLCPEASDRGFHITIANVLFIRTLEGSIQIDIGDWIIKEAHNEILPCKNDIFRQTYRPSGEDHCRYCKFDGEERRPCDAYERCCFEWKEDNNISQEDST